MLELSFDWLRPSSPAVRGGNSGVPAGCITTRRLRSLAEDGVTIDALRRRRNYRLARIRFSSRDDGRRLEWRLFTGSVQLGVIGGWRPAFGATPKRQKPTATCGALTPEYRVGVGFFSSAEGI
ncbi:uncharacterized protein BO80DRAFT_441703 [Aspergillus ibericus CBS 121593]|uniref:Uncharacterized protein n=1 Tax=Aspergillus ibericus CBS 121593 TaxID=1448316 RepID=A0A395HCH6_9EURO|nr:hypothetical protein BO80DRAFT_441703 [Aspergillus ibericus CBS 121593]RAL04855.1 hypothetical protein BO80DRAFT_441703 [Aspergillus ibericus CBS 121593]